MKVIIPVAGMGTRLRPHTHSQPKALLLVAGKTILEYILDEVIKLKPSEIIFITGYLGDKIEQFIKKRYDINAKFVHQSKQLGIAHALRQAETYITEEPLLIILGDTILTFDYSLIGRLQTSALGVKAVEDPRHFGVVELDEKSCIRNLVEKPENPTTNLAIAGIYYILHPHMLFGAIERLFKEEIKTKGEYQLTDALGLMIKGGERMCTFEIDGWYDCGKPDALLYTNRVLLERIGGKGTHTEIYPGSILRPPVWIDPGARIERSIVGPHVTVGADAHITESIVLESIISAGATVENIMLHDSLVGEDAIVTGSYQSLNVGDHSEIKLR